MDANSACAYCLSNRLVSNLLNRLWSTILRLLLALFGMLVVAGVMAVGALLGIALIGWALLRGKRAAPIDLRWRGPVGWRRGVNRAPVDPAANPEVVDIEAHEIDDAPLRTTELPQQDDARRPGDL